MKVGEYWLSKMGDGTVYHLQSVFTVVTGDKENTTIHAYDVGREHLGSLRINQERLLKKISFDAALKHFIEVKCLNAHGKLNKMLNALEVKYVK